MDKSALSCNSRETQFYDTAKGQLMHAVRKCDKRMIVRKPIYVCVLVCVREKKSEQEMESV